MYVVTMATTAQRQLTSVTVATVVQREEFGFGKYEKLAGHRMQL